MRKQIKTIILLCLFLSSCFPMVAQATNTTKNIEIVQFSFLEDGSGQLSVYYGYPIENDAVNIEKTILVDEKIKLIVSELSINNSRFATVCCSVHYQNIEDLSLTISEIPQLEYVDYKNTLFNFYVLLDSIAQNLDFKKIDNENISLSIDTVSFVNQKYYMTRLDSQIKNILVDVDTTSLKDVETDFYLIVSKDIAVLNTEQFQARTLNDIYTEYSCKLNNQKLTVTLSHKASTNENIDANTFTYKLNAFLNSKYYNWFVIFMCTFIVIAICILIFVAKSYTRVVEKEEKRLLEEKLMAHSENDPKLYWSQAEREQEKRKKDLMKNPNALVRDEDLQQTDSIEVQQYKRQSSFK